MVTSQHQSAWVKAQDYAQRNYECLANEPALFLMRKSARFEWVRHWVGLVNPPGHRQLSVQDSDQSLFPHVDVDRVVQDLETDGLALHLTLPPDILNELLTFAKTATCYGDRDSSLPFHIEQRAEFEQRLGRSLLVGSYLDSHIDCPAFQRLINDPKILAIAARYLHTETPRYLTSEIAWSFPSSSTLYQQLKAAQVFHYDIDDYKCIKFFFYLTDVDDESGPHACIRKSHRNKKLFHQVLGQRCASISDERIMELYGKDHTESICGPAGSGFVEDIFCFHKGVPPRSKTRLLLQFEYTMNYYKGARLYT
jgi:hypothetical protein